MYGAVVSGGHLLVVLPLLASLVVLVAVLALCVCFKRKTKSDGLDSGAGLEGGSEAQPSPIDQSNVNPLCVLDEVPAVHRHDVHSVPSIITAANGSAKGQDHRALPALPAVPTVSTPDKPPPDDDPDPEGNYDVISGTKKSTTSHSMKQPSIVKPVKDHCYETVADAAAETDVSGLLNTDDMPYIDEPDYAGVDYDEEGASAQVNETVTTQVAPVELRADAVYAQVDDRRSARNTKTLSADYGAVPPVPVKMFDIDDDNVPRTEHSPSLPPRNGAEMNGHVYATPGEPADRTSVSSSGAGDDGTVMTTGHPAFTPATDAGDGSEPRYSRVTARESLDNLRRRQAASRSIGVPSSRLSVPTDRASQMSDLYAEISSGSGQDSARSSTYAQVGEDIGDTPAPPPVETLKNLSKSTNNNNDSMDSYDPGYSRIKYKSSSGVPSAPRMVSSVLNESGRRSPVYAVVDKSKKTKMRNTVHGDLLSNTGEYDNVDYPALPPLLTTSRPATTAIAEPGYQTIGSALDFKASDEGAASAPADYDPDYEVVSQFGSQPGSREGSRAGSLRGNTRQASSASSSLRKKPWPWLNQEHIYQEINETRLNPPSLSLPESRKSGQPVKITGV